MPIGDPLDPSTVIARRVETGRPGYPPEQVMRLFGWWFRKEGWKRGWP
jgi:hypothetical protein